MCGGDGEWVTWTSNSFNPVISGKCRTCNGTGYINEIFKAIKETKDPIDASGTSCKLCNYKKE